MPSVAEAIDRMLALRAATRAYRGRQATVPSRHALHRAQREMFHLAQVICGKVEPATQRELDTVRREIVQHYISPAINGERQGGDIGYSFTTTTARNKWIADWTRVDISPGIAIDYAVAGIRIPKRLVGRLQTAIRQQVQVVNQCLTAARSGKLA